MSHLLYYFQFVLSICPSNIIGPIYKSGGALNPRPLSSGHQDFQTDPSLFPLNQPLDKLEAIIQSSGEAQYVNDIPPLPNQVFAAFVLSTVHGGDVDVVQRDVLVSPVFGNCPGFMKFGHDFSCFGTLNVSI